MSKEEKILKLFDDLLLAYEVQFSVYNHEEYLIDALRQILRDKND